MTGLEAVQDTGPVQEIVHQRVDRDHAPPDFDPPLPPLPGAQKQAGQGHAQNFVRDTIHLTQRREQGASKPCEPVWCIGFVSFSEARVDPTNQIACRHVPDEQEQAVGGLVEPAIAQAMRGQGTVWQVLGLGAGARALVVSAVVEMPVALKLGAGSGAARQSR